MPESFSDRVKALRSRKGLTRAALAHMIGVSRPTMWAWETGKGYPRSDNVMALAEALAVSAEFLQFGASLLEGNSPQEDSGEMSLQEYVAHAKRRIALLAGTDIDKVTIQIEY